MLSLKHVETSIILAYCNLLVWTVITFIIYHAKDPHILQHPCPSIAFPKIRRESSVEEILNG